MAFGGEVHHRIGAMLRQDPVQRGAVANIRMLKAIARAAGHRRDVGQVRRIGQRVQIHDVKATLNRKAHHRGTDEPRPARHKNFHASPS